MVCVASALKVQDQAAIFRESATVEALTLAGPRRETRNWLQAAPELGLSFPTLGWPQFLIGQPRFTKRFTELGSSA